jgi:CheY-like chemotaxis protein
VVADEDQAVAGLVIETLLDDGHAVFQAYDGLSAVELALGLKVCDLVISNTRVGGVAGLELIHELRAQLPDLPIVYLANQGRSWSGGWSGGYPTTYRCSVSRSPPRSCVRWSARC